MMVTQEMQSLLNLYKTTSFYKKLSEKYLSGKSASVSECVGSALSFYIANLYEEKPKSLLFLCDDKEEAAYYLNDLEHFIGKERVLFFPSSYKRPYQVEEVDNANVLMRAEVLSKLRQGEISYVIVSYYDALFEKVITPKELEKNTLTLSVGASLSIDLLNDTLTTYHFQRVDFVTEPGEFSIRGGIVDVFSFSNDTPYRIEFFGNEIESIRSFDVESQLSEYQLRKITIIPNVENKSVSENRQSFLHSLPAETCLFLKNKELFAPKIDKLFQKAEELYARNSQSVRQLSPSELYCTASELVAGDLLRFQCMEISGIQGVEGAGSISCQTRPQPTFNKRFELLIDHLNEKYQQGFSNYILCITEQQAKRLQEIFKELHTDVDCTILVAPIYMGFTDLQNKINIYTDHQILERYHKFNLRNGYEKKQAITLKELNQLAPGDYVTHIDHGIGRFAGLQKIDIDGKMQEAIKLVYGGNDILYVNIHSLHKISKYAGKEGKPPKIYKLGSDAWKNLKQKTKARVKEIAFSLINLYASRKQAQGYACAPDSYLQKELEASFLYEDTPDQYKATIDVKMDMENEKPMDRLVCGDVGFGKTEVAIRAAFKAVDNSKQVAVLVPTTILAFQHYKTFSERLKDLPVRIDYLNRFRSAKDKKEIMNKLASGEIDIIIGTHQLANDAITYKDLGLLIVDEEQKLGVAVKDKLKTLRTHIDVLTLTATPIPRTLQFSLMAARDLSVIATPPANRYPIESQVITFDEELIRDAVSYEIQRGGQVFFIHNRVENIKEIAGMIQRLVPDARIAIGHGQMEGKKLEEMLLAFMNGAYDVLVATTIIESGLDVPNANTIFIHNAQNFGLSDLHQMRGRVGRSNKKAFCYFITPPAMAMTADARKRIEAIAQFSELGSGFNIAMKDLEIRGAGDLLGGEQSGFINDIGFETYQKILQEAITELKENEFETLYQAPEDEKTYIQDIQIDSDFELLFPDDYINNTTQRLNLYNELSAVKNESDLQVFEKNLEDRFGKLPRPTKDLMNSLRIKWIGTKLGFERLIMKKKQMVAYFVSDPQSKYYQTDAFAKILKFVEQNADTCQLTEKQTNSGLKLVLTIGNIYSVDKALAVIRKPLNL